MKKYILGLTIISSLFMANVGLAMEKKKEVKTSLSTKEETELRQAMKNYKNNKSRAKQEKIINKYKNNYPNDPLVKAKINEKARFDNPQQSEVKEIPSVQQPVKEEIQLTEQSIEGKPNLRITNRESKRIEVVVQYSSYTLATLFKNGRKIVEPQETILMYMPEADRRDMSIDVYVLDSSGNRYGGYSDIFRKRIKKGEMLDLIYKDDRKYYPWKRDKFGPDPDYYRSDKPAPHLYEVGEVKL